MANVVHIRFTGLATNYWYDLVANMPYPADWDYSYTSAADAVGAGKLTFPTSGVMASTVSDGSGNLSVFIGDLNGGLGYRGIDSFTLTQGVAFPVPEPASLALVALGLAGLGFARRKRA